MILTRVRVWPSATEVELSAVTVDLAAEGTGVWKVMVAVCVNVIESVTSVATNVSDSAAESVTVNVAWPFASVVAGDPEIVTLAGCVPCVASETDLLDTGLPPAVRRVTVTVVPAPTGSGEDAVTVDSAGDTVRVPNVTWAVLVRTRSLSVSSVAVKVTDSFAVSVAVKVATPAEFVTLDPVVAGVITTVLPEPARETVCPATPPGGEPWS